MFWNGRTSGAAAETQQIESSEDGSSGVAGASALAEMQPITDEAQWQRISGFLQASIGSTETACRLQSAAADQIDAAQYALQRMLDELAAVLPQHSAPASVQLPVAATALADDEAATLAA